MQLLIYTAVFTFGFIVGSVVSAIAIAVYEYRNRDEDEILQDEIMKENHWI